MPSNSNPNDIIEQNQPVMPSGNSTAEDVSAADTILAPIPGTLWNDTSGNVQSAIVKAFQGLNARSIIILDANLLSTEADFVGPLALVNAIAAVPASIAKGCVFFLRPGTYAAPITAISDVSIVGGSSTNTIIQNTGGAITLGSNASIMGVTLSATTNLVVGSVSSNAFNVLKRIGLSITGSVNVISNANTFEDVTFTSGSGLLNITGSDNVIKNNTVLPFITLGAGGFLNLSGTNNEILNTTLSGCAVGAAASLLKLDGAIQCTVDGMQFNSLIGSSVCVLTGGATANQRCVVKNINTSSVAVSTVQLDLQQSQWLGLTLENVEANSTKIYNPSLSVRQTGPAIALINCKLVNTLNTLSALDIENFGANVVVDGCVIQSQSTNASLQITDSAHIVVRDSLMIGGGISTIAASNLNAGTSFENCSFIGPSSGTLGTQLFNGHGLTGGLDFQVSPMVIRNCTMEINVGNNKATANSFPQVFFGGQANSVDNNHGAIVVNGLRIAQHESSFFTGHRSPTLCIDSRVQAPGEISSYSNITIDLGNLPFLGDASTAAVLTPFDFFPVGSIVEIDGPRSTPTPSANVLSTNTVVQGLSIVNIPRDAGAGNRMVLAASGVIFEDLTIDANPGVGSPGTWNSCAVGVQNSRIKGAEFWGTTSLPLGNTSAFLSNLFAIQSVCENVNMRNFAVGAVEQGSCVFLLSSTLSNSYINMEVGANVPTGIGFGIVCASDYVNSSKSSRVTNNDILFNHNSSSNSDIIVGTLVTSADGAIVSGNHIVNKSTSQAAGYSSIPASSNGGGAQIAVLSCTNVLVTGNRILYEWETDTDTISSLTTDSDHTHIIDNFITNTATAAHGTAGGSNRVAVTNGSYSVVSNNHIEGGNSGNRIILDTSGGNNEIVIGNHVDNLIGTGVITLSGTGKPTPSASFNFTT